MVYKQALREERTTRQTFQAMVGKELAAVKGQLDAIQEQWHLGQGRLDTQLGGLKNDLDMALTAYNRGPGPVDAALMRGKSPDNGYSGKIRSVYERLREMNAPVTKSKP